MSTPHLFCSYPTLLPYSQSLYFSERRCDKASSVLYVIYLLSASECLLGNGVSDGSRGVLA